MKSTKKKTRNRNLNDVSDEEVSALDKARDQELRFMEISEMEKVRFCDGINVRCI